MTASDDTDLPEPDSPTMPSTSPRRSVVAHAAHGRDRRRPRCGTSTVQVADLEQRRAGVGASASRSGRHGRLRRWTFGSSASRRPSPTRLTASTSTTSKPAGNIEQPREGERRRRARRRSACRARRRAAGRRSRRTTARSRRGSATLTLIVASMISSDAMFGRMCRKMICRPGTPMKRAAEHVLALAQATASCRARSAR